MGIGAFNRLGLSWRVKIRCQRLRTCSTKALSIDRGGTFLVHVHPVRFYFGVGQRKRGLEIQVVVAESPPQTVAHTGALSFVLNFIDCRGEPALLWDYSETAEHWLSAKLPCSC